MKYFRLPVLMLICLFLLTGMTNMVQAEKLVRVTKVKNRAIQLQSGETAELTGMLFDPQTGLIGFAIADTGGILGIGGKEGVLPWQALDMQPDGSFRVASGVVLREMPDVMSLMQAKALYLGADMEDPITEARKAVTAKKCGAVWDCDRLLELDRVLYSWVRRDGKEIGLINDVLIDPATGQVVLLVMERGAYFFRWVEVAMEQEKVLLPWPSVQPVENDILQLALMPERLTDQMIIPKNEPVSVGLTRAEKIYEQLGYSDYWTTLRTVLD